MPCFLLQFGLFTAWIKAWSRSVVKLLPTKVGLSVEGLGDEPRAAYRMVRLGDVAAKQSRWDEAQQLYEQGVALSQRVGSLESEVYGKHGLVSVASEMGNYELALALARETLNMYEQLGIRAKLDDMRVLVEELEGKLVSG